MLSFTLRGLFIGNPLHTGEASAIHVAFGTHDVPFVDCFSVPDLMARVKIQTHELSHLLGIDFIPITFASR